MKPYTQKWAVIACFETFTENDLFHKTDVPLHVTLAGIFKLNNISQLEPFLSSVSNHTKRFYITGKNTEKWDSYRVTTFSNSNFDTLYKKIQKKLIELGAVFDEPEYLNDNFVPHVTKQKESELAIGHSKEVTQIALIDLYPNKDNEMRKFAKVWSLKNE